MTALKDLLAKVEAGTVGLGLNTVSVFGDNQTAMDAVDAFDGSIDAAKALHDAVLPGYRWGRQWSEHMWVEVADIPGRSDRYYGKNADPARSWLLAIIRALIAQEGEA